MVKVLYRPTFAVCSLLGMISACGQDEAVFPGATSPGGDAGESGTTTPSTTVPAPSNTAVPPPSTLTTQLAAACARDSDCGTGLKCLTSESDSWLGGGVAHGYCTAECSAADGDAFCDSLTQGAICVPESSTGTAAFCMPTCTPGTAANPKCQSREDVSCDLASLSGVAFCRPMCRADADCDGRKCLTGSGVCVDSLPGSDAVGAACDPAGQTNSCTSGFCTAGITDGTADVGYCSGLCTFGAGGCGSTSPIPEKAGDASCFPVFSNSGQGDLGLCLQTCNCDLDCDADKFVCAQIPGVKDAYGVEGFCFEFDLEIPTDSKVVLGIECLSAEGGLGDAMADTGPADATVGPDAAHADAAEVDAMTTSSSGSMAADAADAH